MTLVSDIRKTVTDITPVYVAVGVTDLAVEKARDARVRATAVRADLDVKAMQDRAVKRAEKVADQAQQIPTLALNQTLEVAGKAQETYAGLAARGKELVKRIRNQKATKDLFAQAGSTVSLGKGAVTTIRKAAIDTRRAAKATLTTGRRQAEVVVDAVAASVQDEVSTARSTARNSAAATRASAKRTATTARNSTASVRRATKSVATSAGNTATKATEAVEVATPKVGD
jgi:heparin binding hemagglutinin HbhA